MPDLPVPATPNFATTSFSSQNSWRATNFCHELGPSQNSEGRRPFWSQNCLAPDEFCYRFVGREGRFVGQSAGGS